MVFNWLKNLFVDSPEKALEKAAINSDVFKIGRQVFREVFDDKSQGLGKFANEKFKNKMASELIQLMGSILISTNPLITNRDILCDGIIGQAQYVVLVAEEEIQGNLNFVLKGLPIVSGKLQDHIMEIAEKDDDIKDLKVSVVGSKGNVDQKSLYEACAFKYWIYSLKVKVFNHIRAAIEVNEVFPADLEKDWFYPLVESQQATNEELFRQKIGLKSILDTDKIQATLKMARSYTLIKFVENGEKYPYLKWEETYKKEWEEEER